MKRIALPLVAGLLVVSSPAAFAGGKPTTTPTPKGKPSATASQWLLPAIGTAPTEVKAGSAIPLKFRLVNGSTEIKSVSGVSVTLVGTPCPTPGPSVTATLSPAKPGKSAAAKLRYQGNSFQYQWKLAKDTAVGCYQFRVTSAAPALTGATIRVVS